jgi:hypothetical protein
MNYFFMKISQELKERLKEKDTFEEFEEEYMAIHEWNPAYANTFAGMLEISRGLNIRGTSHLIIGGLAVASYVHQVNPEAFRNWRGTSDIDLLVPHKKDAEAVLNYAGYKFKQSQKTKPGMIGRLYDYAKDDDGETTVVGLREGICDKSGRDITSKLLDHKTIIPVHGIMVSVPQLKYLLEMKKWANRPKDREDRKTLKDISRYM